MSTARRPLLFHRKTQDLLADIDRELCAPDGLAWQGHPGGAGQAMLGLFGRFADIIAARLNQVPRQHFLAFLSEGGIDQLPPRAATVRLRFEPENDARPAIPVPAGTQIATRASADLPEIIFETAHAIQVIAAKLAWCIALDQRTLADRTKQANGLDAHGVFPAFQGDDVRERILYLGHELLTFEDPVIRASATVTLHFELDPGVRPTGDWTLDWSYFDGEKKAWAAVAAAGATVTDGTERLTRTGDIRLNRLPELGEAEIDGNKGRWLACRLVPASEQVTLPRINEISIHRAIHVSEQKIDPLVFSVSQAGAAFAQVKPEDGFYPFGQYPALLDGLYFRANEAFTKPGATIELQCRGDGLPDDIKNTSVLKELAVAWEYFSAEGWTRLGESQWGSYTAKRLAFRDPTCAFTARTGAEEGVPSSAVDPGIISFTVPGLGGDDPPFAETEVNGQTGYWVRAFIEKGGYSEPQPMRGGLLQRLLLGKLPAPPPKAIPPLVRSLNARYKNYRPSAESGPVVDCFGKADGGRPRPMAGQGFAPFSASVEHPALYLGFLPLGEGEKGPEPDQAKGRAAFPANTWIELHFEIGENNEDQAYPKLKWEYWNGQGWQALGKVDETRMLSRSGTVGFYGPPDHVRSPEFGREAFWLRVYRPDAVEEDRRSQDETAPANAPAAMPRIASIRLNTVPATNGESLNDAIVGSSNGEKNQVCVLPRAPILPDIQLEVREQDESTEAADQTWLAWKRVPHLLSCGPADRCYTLDPTSGTIVFGDGVHGMIPLAGRNNIRVSRYHTHSGKNGNVGPGSLIVLRSPRDALNEIRRVGNVEPAAGGADLEETPNVELRGPYSLKNRGRAITGEDFEWLAREITGVRRVYCLPAARADGAAAPGWVTVVVVPAPTHRQSDANGWPIPAPPLLRQVREYLEARGLVNLAQARGDIGEGVTDLATEDPDQIQVTGPGFVEVEVVAKVVATSPEMADGVRTEILKRLLSFLDPADGGPDRSGWQPGRDVYISEIKAEIENVPGVDHVKSAYLCTPGRQLQFLTLDGKDHVEAPIPRGSMVATFDRRIMALLADTLPRDNPVTEIRISYFGDGDMATIWGLDGLALPTKFRLNLQPDSPSRITLDRPAAFSNETAFAEWWNALGAEPALVSANRRVRAPIVSKQTETDATGRIHLISVEVCGFQAGEAIAIVPAGQISRRIEPLEVTKASPLDPSSTDSETAEKRKLPVVYVPPGHLVFSGKHDIQMGV